MDPMLDPDLIEFMDDDTLLEAFAIATRQESDRTALLAEIARRDLTMSIIPGSMITSPSSPEMRP